MKRNLARSVHKLVDDVLRSIHDEEVAAGAWRESAAASKTLANDDRGRKRTSA